MHKVYKYNSCFSELITQYISERRNSGFMFDNPAYWLYRFDQYCLDNKIQEVSISKKLYQEWASISASETKVTQNNRLQALRGFSVYLNTLGIISYIPHVLPKAEKNVPYLMEDTDILAFFEQLDRYNPHSTVNSFNRMATEYKVLFRVIYCCGLRNNEACSLKIKNVDTVHGVITIIHSKGDKDRAICLSEDVRKLCSQYKAWLVSLCPTSEWFFPGKYPEQHIPKTSVDRKFNEFWNATHISANIWDIKDQLRRITITIRYRRFLKLYAEKIRFHQG
ncbi:MAG: tyrosine-type recombinase/integrase [Blautia sp.]|uniref:tyrosine-type recombinase/integrase n=1 Tax=Blautia sp. TaxID=1955243 RepID=UPI00257F7FEB|nr:tyrosine-type recombinase/integrase [Blautia sp.]MBS5123809.1 tyrosine-type recombinase/integrase [Blautia sp.]